MRSELGVRVGTGLGVVGSEGSRSTAPEAEGLLHGLHGTEVAQCLGGPEHLCVLAAAVIANPERQNILVTSWHEAIMEKF